MYPSAFVERGEVAMIEKTNMRGDIRYNVYSEQLPISSLQTICRCHAYRRLVHDVRGKYELYEQFSNHRR